MKTRVIVVEFRPPLKHEKGLFGLTESDDGITKVFINSKQSQGEEIDTFFHEMAHAYMHWNDIGLTEKDEERIARLVGNVAEPCFRKYK